jgi:hypothetical protein
MPLSRSRFNAPFGIKETSGDMELVTKTAANRFAGSQHLLNII